MTARSGLVYERADRIGGLRYGIPEFKMQKRRLNRRVEQMMAEGTTFYADVISASISAWTSCAPSPTR
jgi:glutamate synthase (NADPH/NADH) small chain